VLAKRLHARISEYVKLLQRFVDRIWYAPVIGILAGLDNFVVVVPTDGILISSSMLNPRRWLLFAAAVAIGSTMGAVILAAFVELHGLPWILEMFPGVDQSRMWALTDQFFSEYGLLVVFLVAATPLMQQPTVILAALANTPLMELTAVIFAGRAIKFLIMAYLGSHAPRVLGRLWGLKGELEDAGVKLP